MNFEQFAGIEASIRPMLEDAFRDGAEWAFGVIPIEDRGELRAHFDHMLTGVLAPHGQFEQAARKAGLPGFRDPLKAWQSI